MVPPTPLMPTRLHVPADQSLLLATEPIWENDSFDLGVNPGNRGMEISTGRSAAAGSGMWESPCGTQRRAAPLLRDQASLNSPTRQSRSIHAVENVRPASDRRTGEGRTASGRDPLSRPCTSATTSKFTARSLHCRTATASLEPVVEQPAYTGMTGRRDRRDRFSPPPEVPSQRRGTRQRTELDCRESGSEQGPRPTTDRRGENGEGSKRRREASPVESVPVKKVKSRSPVKDDFYTRRVKDSDRRSSLGPKSPLIPASTLPVLRASPSTSPLVQSSALLGGSIRSSRSFSVVSSGTPRPSPLSTGSSTVALPVVGDADQVSRGVLGQRSRDSGARVSRSDVAPSGRSTPSVDAAEASVAELGTGRSALSRYLAKATSQTQIQDAAANRQHLSIATDASATRDNGQDALSDPALEKAAASPPIYPQAPRTMSTGLYSVGVTGSTTTIATTSTIESSSWTAPVPASSPANKSILAMAGDALRDVSQGLRRSLSRSSLSGSASIPVRVDTPKEARRQVEDGARHSGKSQQDDSTERLSTKAAESEESAQHHMRAPYSHGCTPSSATAAPGSNPPRDTNLEEAELEREAARLAGDEPTPPADVDDCARPEDEGADDLANAVADSAAPHLHQSQLGHARPGGRAHAHYPSLPAPLTRPGRAYGTTTATRALQPRTHANIPASAPPSSLSSLPAVKISSSARTVSGAPTSLAARALARLPPPGSASAAALAQCKTSLKENERAKELAQKRARYEELARGLEESKKRRIEAVVPPRAIRALPLTAHRVNSGGSSHNRRQAMQKAQGKQVEAEVPMTRTIPIAGATPGKASRARAQARADFEAGLRARQEEKERQQQEVQRARQEMEEEEYRLQRMETVVRARELPAIYSRRV